MKAYKLVRVRKDGSIGPLFINRKLRYIMGQWHQAEDHPTKGFAHRPGFHCTFTPDAPHLKMMSDRVWIECEVKDFVTYDRPVNQGGKWILANQLKPIKIYDK